MVLVVVAKTELGVCESRTRFLSGQRREQQPEQVGAVSCFFLFRHSLPLPNGRLRSSFGSDAEPYLRGGENAVGVDRSRRCSACLAAALTLGSLSCFARVMKYAACG